MERNWDNVTERYLLGREGGKRSGIFCCRKLAPPRKLRPTVTFGRGFFKEGYDLCRLSGNYTSTVAITVLRINVGGLGVKQSLRSLHLMTGEMYRRFGKGEENAR